VKGHGGLLQRRHFPFDLGSTHTGVLLGCRPSPSRPAYAREFGVAPWFCAGVHAGPIIVNECGGAKRQIAYFGNTMNVAARLCDTIAILVSEFVTDLPLKGKPDWKSWSTLRASLSVIPVSYRQRPDQPRPLSLALCAVFHFDISESGSGSPAGPVAVAPGKLRSRR